MLPDGHSGMIWPLHDVEPAMQVEIWSDLVCPWCYIGKRRFESALASFDHPIEVVWRSYELDPAAPSVREGSSLERIAAKYGMTVEQATAQQQRITDLAAGEGLDYHLDHARSGRSFDAHRLLHLARERGIQDAVKERLLAGYLQEGVAIGLPDELSPWPYRLGSTSPRCARSWLETPTRRRCAPMRRRHGSSGSPASRSSWSTVDSPSRVPKTRTPSGWSSSGLGTSALRSL